MTSQHDIERSLDVRTVDPAYYDWLSATLGAVLLDYPLLQPVVSVHYCYKEMNRTFFH